MIEKERGNSIFILIVMKLFSALVVLAGLIGINCTHFVTQVNNLISTEDITEPLKVMHQKVFVPPPLDEPLSGDGINIYRRYNRLASG